MHPTLPTAAPATLDEEYTLPRAEALLAGTLALMTGHAQACCDNHRGLMSQKIVSNLTQLAQHAPLSPSFKTMLWNLRGRWCEQQERHHGLRAPQTEPSLWHASPSAIQ